MLPYVNEKKKPGEEPTIIIDSREASSAEKIATGLVEHGANVKKQMLEALKNVGLRLPAIGGTAEARAAAGGNAVPPIALPDAPLEAKQLGALKKQIVEKVKAEPLPTTRLVQTWIREGDEA